MASEASALPAEAHSGQTATPNPKVATGRSNMAAFGSRLASQMTITRYENEEHYPIRVHVLHANELLRMFHRMLMQIVLSINRELGHPDPTQPASADALRNIGLHVAYAALQAAYAVTYNKARTHDPMLVRNFVNPSLTYITFPVYITALINSLGPIQLDDVPSRRTHIPLLNMDDITALFPNNYRPNYLTLFKEKIQKTKILFANVEPHGAESVAWWSFWPSTSPMANPLPDPTYAQHDSPNNDVPHLLIKTVYSPVKYDDTMHFLKLPMVYATRPLAYPGFGAWSASRYYTADELPPLPDGVLPTFNQFPADVMTHPNFWENASAYMPLVESRLFIITTIDEEPDEARDAVRVPARRPAAEPARQRRRIGDSGHPVGVDVVLEDNQETIPQYRVVFYYFDHIALRDITPPQYLNWVYEMCQSN